MCQEQAVLFLFFELLTYVLPLPIWAESPVRWVFRPFRSVARDPISAKKARSGLLTQPGQHGSLIRSIRHTRLMEFSWTLFSWRALWQVLIRLSVFSAEGFFCRCWVTTWSSTMPWRPCYRITRALCLKAAAWIDLKWNHFTYKSFFIQGSSFQLV